MLKAEDIIRRIEFNYLDTVKFQLDSNIRIQFGTDTINGFWVRIWLKKKNNWGEIKLAKEILSKQELAIRIDDLIGQDLLPCW